MKTLGIDIGGSGVKIAIMQGEYTEFSATSERYSNPERADIVKAIREAFAGAEGFSGDVGLCCPGLFDRSTNSISLSVNLPRLVGVDLNGLVAEALGKGVRRVSFLSDANAVGYDLYRSRGLTGRLLCLSLGTGVGASVVNGAGFLHVSGESPGHLGQLDVSLDDDPPVGADGGAGSLEAYIGARALGGVDVATLRVTDAPLRALIRALRVAHAVYRPDHVALAGGVGIGLVVHVPGIMEAVNNRLTSVAKKGWTLFTAEHAFHAAMGAARWAAREVQDDFR